MHLTTPIAPMSIKRIPQTGDLLMIFNNNPKIRVPLTAAVSRDEGKTWKIAGDLETEGIQFAYDSITFIGDKVFMTYWTQLEKGKNVSFALKLRVLPYVWFYE